MNKYLSFLILGIVFPIIQLLASNNHLELGIKSFTPVTFFSTTQIVCPLNATSFPATIDVPIKVTGFNKITSTQGSISWDTAVIKFSYISSNGSSPSFSNTNFITNPAGYLTFNWADITKKGITLPDSSFFCTIRFTINGSFGNTSKITLSSSPTAFNTIDSIGNILPTYTSNGLVILTTGSSVNISSATSFCQGDSALLSSSAGTSYQWFFNGSPILYANNQTYNAYNTGTYSVLTTLTNGCNTYSKDINITAIAAPSTPVISSNTSTTSCNGGFVILTSTASNSYQWYLNGSAISGGNSQSYTASTSGNYTVVTSNSAGCTSPVSAATKVTFNTLPPTPFITLKGATTFCSNSFDTLVCSSGSGYQWYLNGVAINGATNQSLVVNSTGTYTVTTSNNSCISNTSTAVILNVTAVTQPVINVTGNTNLCPGNSVLLSANNSYSYYQWYLNGSPVIGANGPTYNAFNGGSYTLQAGFQGGCLLTSTPVVVTAVNVIAPTINTAGATTFCTGSSVLLSCSNNAYNSYQWYINGSAIASATAPSFTASTSGVYTVNVTTSTGCNSTTSSGVSVVVNPIPGTPTIATIGSTSLCSGSSLTLISSSANNYQWNNNGTAIANSTAQSNIVTTAGSYTVTVANAYGCSAISQPVMVTLIPKTTPNISTTGNIAFCQGGAVQMNASNGYTSYQWYQNNILITTATSSSYSTSVAGSYTVSGTTTDGCLSNVSAAVNVSVYNKPSTPVISSNGVTTLCAGSSTTLSSTVEYSYSWFLNSVLLSNTSNPNLNVNTAGSYTVITTNANGCTSSVSNPVSISVTTPPTPTITAVGSTTICNGDSVQLKTILGNAYQWYLNGIKINNSNSQSIYANANGNYTVSVTYPSGCTATSIATGITVYSSPTPLITSNSTIICPGTTLTLSATTGFNSYQWYRNGVAITNAINANYTTSTTGTYSVVGTNSFGCVSSPSQSIILTAGSTPATPSISNTGSTSFCPGGSVILNSPNNGYTTYQWYLNGSLLTDNTQYITATKAGIYAVAASNIAGCTSTFSASVAVTIYPTPATPLIYSSTGSDSLCPGNSLTVSTPLQSSYQWYLNGNSITNATAQNYVVNTAGDYSVSITNSNGCNANSAIKTITVIAKTTPVISTTSNTSFCKGSNALLSTTGFYTYQWYLNNQAISGAINATYAADSTGNYTVMGNTYGGCPSYISSPVSITVFNNPATPVLTASPTIICAGNSTAISATSASSYAWYYNGTLVSTTTNSIFTASAAGNYNVIAFNQNGCKSNTSNSITINVITPATPTISVAGNTSICNGDSVLLTSSAGKTYQWYLNGIKINNDTSQSIYASATGNYTVAVTYVSGCTANSNAATITVYSVPTPVITYNSLVICQGNNLALNTTTGLAYYQWYLNGTQIIGANNATYYTSGAGNYSVMTYNTIGCNSAISASIQLTTTASPSTPTITASTKNFCHGDTVYLASSTGNTYQWYFNGNKINNATNGIYATTVAGSYSVVVTNAAGCSSPNSVSMNIVEYPYTIPNINTGGTTNICNGNSLLLTSSNANSYQWYFGNFIIAGANSQTFTATLAGVYTTKIKDNNGCNLMSTPITITVEYVNPPTINLIGNATFCNGDSTSLMASLGYTNYQWYLNGNPVSGANGFTLSVKSNGNYSVTGTSLSGCVSAASPATKITVSGIPAQPVITATSNGICTGGSVVLNSNSTAGNYQWYLNGNPVIGANSQTFTAYSSGSYSMTATNTAGCTSVASTNYIITNYSTTPVITTTGNTVFCNGSSALLTATAGNSYQWYNNNNIITGATNLNLNAVTAGTYTVSVTNSNNCASLSSGVTITVNTVTTPILNSSATTVCKGNNALLTASSGYAYYQWYINGVVVPGITTVNYTATVSGNYTVTGTTAAGCTSPASLPVNFTVSNGPATPSITSSGTTNICVGSSVTLNSTKAYFYQWYYNGFLISGINANSQTLSVSSQGTYTIGVTDSFGCKSAISSGIIVSYLPTPNMPVITPLGNTTICPNSSVTLSATPATTYQWFLNGAAITGANGINYIAKTAGNYTVQVFNSSNCSATSIATTIKAYNASTPTVAVTGSTSYCAGGSATLTATTDSGYTQYQWYNNGVAIAGATNKTFRVDSTGSYYIIATIPGSCSSLPSNATSFNVFNAPSIPVITPAGKAAICKNSTLTLTAPTATGYQWYKNGVSISGAVNQTLTISDSGSYSLLVYNNGGCSTRSQLNTVAKIDTNAVSVGTITKTSFCRGDSVILTASSGYYYQWYNNNTAVTNATNMTYAVKQTGTYSVYAIDSNKCTSISGTTAVNVISSQSPAVITNGASTYCSGNNKTTLSGAPGLSYYQWYKNDTAISNANTANYTPLTSGTYTLVAYNTGDCPSLPSAAAGITIIPTPAKPLATSNGITQLCNGKNILLISSTGSAYQWYRNGVALSGASYQSYNASTPGYYSVQNISNGCSSALSDSIVINKVVNAGFTVNTISQELCSNNFILNASYPYATNKYYWNFGDGAAASTLNTSHIYAKKGTYTIKQIVTSSDNSCIDSITQTVSVTKCTSNGITEEDSVNIYPNPNNGVFKVKFLSVEQRNARVAVIGASTGIIFLVKDIVALEGRNTINIDMSSPMYKPGVYIVRIIGDNITYNVQRFVLIR